MPCRRYGFRIGMARSTRPVHLAIRPRSPTAHPASCTPANARALYAAVSTIVHRSPPSVETAVPTSPVATNVRAPVPGTYATADRYPGGVGPGTTCQVAPPSCERATFTYGVFGWL